MKYFLILIISVFYQYTHAQESVFPSHTDIGNPSLKGSVNYTDSTGIYTLKSSGYNIWFNRDEFHYAYNWIKGDFILTANFAFEDESGDPHKKMGWMVRESADDQSAHLSATLHGNGLNEIQWRELRGAYMRDPEDEIRFPKKKIQVVQLERRGKTFYVSFAPAGEPLQLVGEKTMPHMKDSVMAGLFACSHDPQSMVTAKIWNVRIDKPRALRAEQNNINGSRLELMDVTTGIRKVVYQSVTRFEAPNFMPDGKSLLFNENGKLFTIGTGGGAPQYFPTGDLVRNNNDHGISFDGKLLAISNHRDGLPGYGSTVYIMPLEGGAPRLITENTPSYWHGWSPDNKKVLVVGQRGGTVFNIYAVSTKDGSEINVTKNESGHVDGPEFTKDGKWIYYNGNQSGTMQIWRMKPDGTGKEQITFDEYNNWFPHISPDGKWMTIISFPPDINPDDHPANKRVMLRLMPVNGGSPRVLAFIYGGQGTINVPSWSPDSKQISFVSYY
ncbi:MAG: TolB family protein, partial [Chitinophagaceae bacterium]